MNIFRLFGLQSVIFIPITGGYLDIGEVSG